MTYSAEDIKSYAYHYYLWSIAYAECFLDADYLEVLPKEALIPHIHPECKSVLEVESQTLAYLESTYPNISFAFGLHELDLRVNVFASRMHEIFRQLRDLDRSFESQIRSWEANVSLPLLQGTRLPTLVGPLLRGKTRHLKLPDPEGRMAGSDGCLGILRSKLSPAGIVKLRDAWSNKVSKLLDVPGFSIRIPTDKAAISDSNQELLYLSAISYVSAIERFFVVIREHMYRGLLRSHVGLFTEPHRLQKIEVLDEHLRLMHKTKAWLRWRLEDTQEFLDLSGFHDFIEGVHLILKELASYSYVEKRVQEELRANPQALSEYIHWYKLETGESISLTIGYDAIVKRLQEGGWQI